MNRRLSRWCALLGVALTMSIANVAMAQEPKPAGLDVYFIDVLGGAATLVVTPEKESILIDTGWPGFDDRDPKRIEHALKDLAGLDHLDHLVTTHWHRDHFGGVGGLAKLVPIRNFWDRGLPSDRIEGLDFPDGPKDDDPMLVAYLAASEGKRRPLRAGDAIPLKGDIRAIVLTSGGETISWEQRFGTTSRPKPNPLCENAPPDVAEDRSDNARSLSLVFEYGDFSFLDCGDLTWNVEKKLVCPYNLIGPIDVFQVTHHGMDISNHPTLLESIAPTVAVMNNGPRKGGSPETVKRLDALRSLKAAYQLHKNAATAAEENTDAKLIANDGPEGGQFIHLHVEPGGRKYSVRIGEKGEEQTFETRTR